MRSSFFPLAVSAVFAAVVSAHAQSPALVPAPDDSVHASSDVSVQPAPLNAQAFVDALNAGYPQALRDAGLAGSVQVRFVVGADGVPRELAITTSSDSAFDAPTLAAVSVLRFSPAQREGRAVPVWAELPVQWSSPLPAVAAASQPDSTGAYRADELTGPPRPLNLHVIRTEMETSVPTLQRYRPRWGTVHVKLRVDERGIPDSIEVIRTADRKLNGASIRAVSQLRFEPATLHGQPVAAWAVLPIEWMGPLELSPWERGYVPPSPRR